VSTSLTYSDMLLMFPEFRTENTARVAQVDRAITSAERFISETAFGDMRDDAILCLGAHNLSLADRSNVAQAGGAGQVTARTTGEAITSYAVHSKGDGYDRYRTTPYGLMYLDMVMAIDLTPFVT